MYLRPPAFAKRMSGAMTATQTPAPIFRFGASLSVESEPAATGLDRARPGCLSRHGRPPAVVTTAFEPDDRRYRSAGEADDSAHTTWGPVMPTAFASPPASSRRGS
ncbi:hypothetical protein CDD83_619 [Cordyceps sp. RAO-2017]|nr:hypothetical protein CDD83_619 [Cordyceps sp. RAO-2017]